MKRIITVQHTQSVHHTNGMVGSWTDWELTELGLKQAENIGRNLAKEIGGRKYVMYSSDLKRAKQTAEKISEQTGIIPVFKSELRERNLGKCCGKSVEWLRANIEKQEKTVDDKMFSDAESRRDEWQRLEPFFNEIINNDEENIIVVSHGDLLGVFNAMFLNMPVEALDNCEIRGKAGCVTFMVINEEGKRYMTMMGTAYTKE